MQHDVFISYRRDGGFETANLVASKLRFAGYRVFLDIHAMHEGDFSIQLEEKVKRCKDFLWVLSPTSIGNENCDIKQTSTLMFREGVDYYRDEICWAIKYHKNIVPIKLNGFHFDKQLPQVLLDTIAKYNPQLSLTTLQSVEALKNQYFDAAVKDISKYLKSFKVYRWAFMVFAFFITIILSLFGYYFATYTKYENISVGLFDADKHPFAFNQGDLELVIDGQSVGTKTIYSLKDDITFTHINTKSKTAILKFSADGYVDSCYTVELHQRILLGIKRDNTYAKYWGTILDYSSNEPLDSVVVCIDGKQTLTNSNGYYEIIFPLENQTVSKRMTAMKTGYQLYDQSIVYPRECRFHLKKAKK